jgi:hypothetical protein
VPNNESKLKIGVSDPLESYLKNAEEKESRISVGSNGSSSLKQAATSGLSQSYLKNPEEKESRITTPVSSSSGSLLKVGVAKSAVQSYLKNPNEKDPKISVKLADKSSYLKAPSSKDSIVHALNNIILLKGSSYQSRLDTINKVDTTTPQYGGLDVLFGNSGFEVSGNTTIYLAQGSDKTEAEVRIPMPACTMKEMRVASSLSPGTNETFTYTLMRNGVASNEMAAQISGSGVSATISLTNGIGFNAGDTFSVRLTTSSGAVTAYHSYSIKIV